MLVLLLNGVCSISYTPESAHEVESGAWAKSLAGEGSIIIRARNSRFRFILTQSLLWGGRMCSLDVGNASSFI